MEQRDFTAASFYKFLGEKKLMASRCRRCGALSLPPRPLCSACRQQDMEWLELSGKGKLAAYTCICVAPTAMVNQGYGKNKPYCSGVVETAEGPKISALILGVDACEPESIKVGTALTAEVFERTEGAEKVYQLAFRAT
ncbi:MAG: Zn-ribbon domain-containing OB-fold protein [Chloroflexi bacterium]|nr:Zn-ribbon domain-containing OB-fold protein [Chloroflexota bacterium]